MSAKFWIQIKFLETLRKPLTHKSTRHWRENALTLTLKGFALFAHWRGSQKWETFGFALVALAMQCKKNTLPVNSTLSFTWKPDIKFAIRAISVFRLKFNVEFTRQAVSFSQDINSENISRKQFRVMGQWRNKWKGLGTTSLVTMVTNAQQPLSSLKDTRSKILANLVPRASYLRHFHNVKCLCGI